MRGTPLNSSNNELLRPLWMSAAQLVFAAVLLYFIRNPEPIQQLEANLQPPAEEPAAIVLNIPISNVAVAAAGQEANENQPMCNSGSFAVVNHLRNIVERRHSGPEFATSVTRSIKFTRLLAELQTKYET